MIKAKVYRKPTIKVKKLKLKLFYWDEIYDSVLLAGTCPGACGPGSCGAPSDPAFCMGGTCKC